MFLINLPNTDGNKQNSNTPIYGSMTTDREQSDREQRRLAEKGTPKYIFTIPRAILPKPSLCDEISDEIM